MEQSKRDGRTAYGKACTNCSKAKYKCISRADGPGCERCQRLKKKCQPSVNVRKRNAARESDPTNPPPGQMGSDLSSSGNSSSSRDTSVMNVVDQDSTLAGAETINNHNIIPKFVPQAHLNRSYDMASEDPYTSQHHESELHTFRTLFLPCFPFINIPTGTTVAELKSNRPFLWLNIRSLTSKSAAEQLTLDESIRQIVSTRITAGHEKSLDLLLGIICYLGWFHYHKKDKSYLVMWTQMAVALVYELNIHKPARREDDAGQFSSRLVGFPPRCPEQYIRTLEERRAILSVYLLTSLVWISLRQMEPMRWTPYMDECVKVLEEARESPLDAVLIAQTKFRRIMDQVTRSSDAEEPLSPTFLKAVLLNISEAYSTFFSTIQSDSTVKAYSLSAEIVVRETALRSQKPRIPQKMPNLDRIQALDALLSTIERWLAVRHGIPVYNQIGTSFSHAAQYSHAIILLFKMTTLDEPGWDRQEVMRRANMLDLLDRKIRDLEETPRLHGLVDAIGTGERGLYFKAPYMICGMKANFTAELIKAGVIKKEQPSSDPQVEIDFELPALDDASAYFLDDPLFPDLFTTSWDF